MFDSIKSLLEKYHTNEFWVAYSGGIDSSVLLHLIKRYKDLKPDLNVKAIHINHNISPNSYNWCQHSSKACKHLNIPITIKTVTSKPKNGDSLESWARENRYHCFENLANNKEIYILLAHHQEDQAETFLLNALRGSGLTGLSAMPYSRNKNRVTYLRPLLSTSRREIEKYAIEHNLKWIDDESNRSQEINRNYLRHTVIPKLNIKWPNSSAQLARAASLCSENNFVLNKYLKEDLASVLKNKDDYSCIDLNKLILFEPVKIKILIKYWVNNIFDIQLPYKDYETISRNLRTKENGWQYHLLSQYHIQKYSNTLSINKIQDNHNQSFEHYWDLSIDKNIYIPSINKTITMDVLNHFGLELHNHKQIVLRSRQPKDRCKPTYRQKSQKLKIIFQELKIPSWKREESIIIEDFKSGKILAVYPHFICKSI
ncbi:tRNA lysidine(34) synthetase TilS [Francisellaceae bacterium]|nr:tRNA lysidine(34) synthetase TilS [Francisellaceae bacterium]